MDDFITGASGFLGSHLVKRLSHPTIIPHQQIWTTSIPSGDRFFFLSAYGNLVNQTDERAIIQANLLDLVAILNQIDFAFKSFVYISTSSVTLKRQTTYSRTKRAAEEILLSYLEKQGWPICIVRPFSITGVGEQPEHLIPTLIDSCYTHKAVNFVPDPTHDYIDVDDVVDGILNLSEHGARGIFELGTGVKTANWEVLKLVEEITGKRANINEVGQLRDYDSPGWVSQNYKARGFGWLPKKSLEQSIREQVQAYEKTH